MTRKLTVMLILFILPSVILGSQVLREEAKKLAIEKQYSQSLEKLELARENFRREGDSISFGKTLAETGWIYFIQKNYTESTKYYIQSIFYSQLQKDSLSTAQSYCNIAVSFKKLGLYNKSKEYYLKLKYTAIDLMNYRLLQKAMWGLGTIARIQSDYNNSIVFYERALEVSEDNKSKLLHNIGITYLKTEQLDKAFYFFSESNRLDSVNNVFNKNLCLSFAEYYYTMNKFSIAKKCLDKIEKQQCTQNLQYSIFYLEARIEKNINKRIELLKRSQQIARKIKNYSKQINAADFLAESYEQQQKFKLANEHLKEAVLIEKQRNKHNTDLINNFLIKITKLEKDNKAKASTIKVVLKINKYQRLIIYSVVALLLLALIFSIIVYRKNILIKLQSISNEQQLKALQDILLKNKSVKTSLQKTLYRPSSDTDSNTLVQVIDMTEAISEYENMYNKN